MKVLVLSLFLMHPLFANAQVVFDNVEQVLALGRDSVVGIAISYLKQSGFSEIDERQFDRLQTQTNGQEIRVIFEKSVHYVAKDTFIVHAAIVTILQMSVSWEHYGPSAATTPRKFYEYTTKDQQAIAFVLNGKKDIPEDAKLIIKDSETAYSITEESFGNGYRAESGYKKDKLTGETSGYWHMNSGTKKIDDGYKNIEW